MQRKWNIKLVLLLTFLGAIGIVLMTPIEIMTLMSDEFDQSNLEGTSVGFVVIVNAVIQIII